MSYVIRLIDIIIARFGPGGNMAVKQVRASHILVNTEQEANNLSAQLKAGKKFADLARQFSTCPSGKAGGDLGFFGKGQMVKQFEEAAFSMKKGQTSPPIRTPFGYHIIMVTDTK
jgi:peptidyl-prolyl cis-trans isomerase C